MITLKTSMKYQIPCPAQGGMDIIEKHSAKKAKLCQRDQILTQILPLKQIHQTGQGSNHKFFTRLLGKDPVQDSFLPILDLVWAARLSINLISNYFFDSGTCVSIKTISVFLLGLFRLTFSGLLRKYLYVKGI